MIEVRFTPAQLRSIEKAIDKLGDVKTANALVSRSARIAAKMFLLQPAKKATPKQTGQLRKSTKIRAIKRSKDAAGVRVGYSDQDFVGDQFYGAFVEYGYRVGPRRLGDARTKVEGQGNLKRVADNNGAAAADKAARLIGDAMVQRAKKK